VTGIPQGEVPAGSSVATSLAPDVGRPPLSLRGLERSAGQRVPSHDRSHQSARGERDTVEGSPFIGRLGQQGWPKGCTRLWDDGVQAPKTSAKRQGLMQEALATVPDRGCQVQCVTFSHLHLAPKHTTCD
jgi:hypothetical protein